MNTFAFTKPTVTVYEGQICMVIAVTTQEAKIDNDGIQSCFNYQRVIDRLDHWMKLSNKNDNQVTVESNIAVGLINKARTEKSDIGKRTIKKIIETYPELFEVWLISGHGQMLKNEPESKTHCELRNHLTVKTQDGRVITLKDLGHTKEYGKIYTNVLDFYEVKEILSSVSMIARNDGKIKIDKSLIIELRKAGLGFIHPDTGEEMNVREVFTALSNMAAEKASNLVK